MAKTFLQLTRAAIRAVHAGRTIHEHGIVFERLASGEGVWSVNLMVDGQRIHRVIGRESEGTTRTQAEGFVEKVRRDARENRLALPKGRKVVLCFKDAARAYVERLAQEAGKDLPAK